MGAIVAHGIGGRPGKQPFVDGLSTALEVAALIAFAGAVVAAVLVRSHAGQEGEAAAVEAAAG
jgi:hypothetical protein